jgi:hypothetical protein
MIYSQLLPKFSNIIINIIIITKINIVNNQISGCQKISKK